MQKKHTIFMISIAVLTIVHLIFSYFYIRMYGYFNLNGNLSSFLLVSNLFRIALDLFIIICGFLALREEKMKFLPFYLLFFLVNLVFPFLFHL
ncbi:hypothetical protein [Enterococcus sp. DIV0660C]|uniref:hypothetical protein n=1 Tax=Enterococcus sp. DIV0660C TaxID=2230880 RepID=UPI00324200F7